MMGSNWVRVVCPVGGFALALRNPPPTGTRNDTRAADAVLSGFEDAVLFGFKGMMRSFLVADEAWAIVPAQV